MKKTQERQAVRREKICREQREFLSFILALL
jgi:hypothetical protein